MHELSLAESMVELIEEQAEQNSFEIVSGINLEIGSLSHVEKEAMIFCFESVTKGTVAENASLNIISVAGKYECKQCGHIGPLQNLYDACGHCGAFGLTVLDGDQVRIRSLEVH